MKLLKNLLVPREEVESKTLMEWAHLRVWNGMRLSKLLIHVPNGAYLGADPRTRAIVMRKLREAGLRPGVSDYILPVPCWPLKTPGMWLELKRQKGGHTSPEQLEFQSDMRKLGWKTVVCEGWVKASEAIDSYLYSCGPPVYPWVDAIDERS